MTVNNAIAFLTRQAWKGAVRRGLERLGLAGFGVAWQVTQGKATAAVRSGDRLLNEAGLQCGPGAR